MTTDTPFRRLWRRVTQRYPATRDAGAQAPVAALAEREPDFAYALLKTLSEGEPRLGAGQAPAFLRQARALFERLGADEALLPPLYEAVSALAPEQGWRWVHFGLSQEAPRAYFSGDSERARAALHGLKTGFSAHEVERVLGFYAEALTGSGLRLRFRELDRAPAVLEAEPVVSLPDRLYAYPSVERPHAADPSFWLYKWLLTHELGHREAGTYALDGAETLQAGHAALGARARALADPHLAEGLFHLFEDVRVEAWLCAQYPGFRTERERLLALEWAFRAGPLAGRAGFLEALVQTLHWGRTGAPTPPAWREALGTLAADAEALREAGATAEDAWALGERAYRWLEGLFDEPPLNAPPEPGLFHGEPALHLTAPAPSQPSAREWRRLPAHGPGEEDELEPGPEEEDGVRANGGFRYDEWDFRAGRYLPAWCALHERPPAEADVWRRGEAHRTAQIRRAFEWMAEEDWARQRRQLEGDELDLDTWVEGMVDRRAGQPLPEKLYTQRLRRQRDLCAAVVLDASDSTARLTPGGAPVIQVEREALGYLCEALEALRDEYALFAYSGDGRAQVDCYCLKGFEEPWAPAVGRRLEALHPLSQNRDGCALRHVTQRLKTRPARTKLLLHITDGKPWDHGYHQRYALADTKRAVQEARAQGIKTFGVICDPHAPAQVKLTYGGRAVILDDLDDLSELLLGVYRRITW